MALQLQHIQDHPSGRKSYRRAYPPHLRAHLGKTQLRVSLGRPSTSKASEDPNFMDRYNAASRIYAEEVARAKRIQSGAVDSLTPALITYLVQSYRAEALGLDEEVRWTSRPGERKRLARENLKAGIAEDLAEAIELRALGDIEEILSMWSEAAADHAYTMGFVLDRTAPEFRQYVRAFHEGQIEIWQAIQARLDGADVPTPPEPELPAAARAKGAHVPLLATFDGYSAAKGISAGVRSEWRNYMQNLVIFLGHDDAAKITRDDVVRWRDHLLATPTRYGQPRKPVTVKDKYITALRCTLGWAEDERKIARNVAADVKVPTPKRTKTRDPDFTMDEANAILKASLERPNSRVSAPYTLARRWIPWLCAYSGARVNELSQLRKHDIREVDGIWIIDITPEAGSVKTREARQVPLHAHIIEQGFLDAVDALPEGSLFYAPSNRRSKDDAESAKANRLFKKVGEKLAKWVREEVGIDDPAIKPNHAWRHLFKTLAAEVGIQERVADAIQGHAVKSVAGGYGKITLKTKAEAIAIFPRFDLDLNP